MTTEARRAYAAAELHTASPQRLRLMLIEAAIGSVEAARRRADAGQWAVAGEPFVHARRAVAELLLSVRTDLAGDEGQLADKVRAIHAFLFRQLTEAQLYRDPQRLDDALRILAMERETWRQICSQAATSGNVDTESDTEAAPTPGLSLHG